MSPKPAKSPLSRSVADLLTQAIRHGTLPPDLSISWIAREYDVSLHTAWQAARILADEGLFLCSQGRRITLAVPAAAGAPSVQDTLYAKVRDGIADGSYPAGRPLPKVNFFVVSEKVSPNSICAVFARLEAEGLIHKIGKSWIVGKRNASSPHRAAGRHPPTVLLLTPLDMEWNRFYRVTFIASFSRMLVSELHDRGIMLSLAFVDKPRQPMSGEGIPIAGGVDDIAAQVKALGPDYLGTLVYCGMGPVPGLSACLSMLARLKKPIVHFDQRDRDSAFAEQMLSDCAGVFHYLHLDEAAAVRLALQALADSGHRTIGVPVPLLNDTWIRPRVDLICRVAKECSPELAIVASEQTEGFWQFFVPDFDIGHYTEALATHFGLDRGAADQRGIAHGRSLRAALLANTPSITRLLDKDGCTALLPLSDPLAREIYLWCTCAGIEVPGRVSLVSFDNDIECNHFPVSTVDFGFSRLGYLAAHLFINDIPVRGKKGDIPGECRLLDRGSLGCI